MPQDKMIAINDLILAYEQDVWNYAFSLTRRPHLADDITQDVFLKAYLHLDTFRGEATAKTWLLSITRNVTYDYRKKAFFRKVTLMERITKKGAYPSAENEALENLGRENVWQLVLELPEKLREVLVLHIHHHLTAAEIGAVLGVTEAAVKSRLHRARSKVAEMLRERGERDE